MAPLVAVLVGEMVGKGVAVYVGFFGWFLFSPLEVLEPAGVLTISTTTVSAMLGGGAGVDAPHADNANAGNKSVVASILRNLSLSGICSPCF